MAEPPVGEWKFRLDAAGAETERLRFELATAEAEIRRLRGKVNKLLELLVEPELPGPRGGRTDTTPGQC